MAQNQNTLKLGQWNAICSKCKEEKPETEYYTGSNGKPMRHCRTCHLKNGQSWRKRNPGRVLELAKKHREQNYEKMLARTREWRAANKEYDAFRQATRRAIKQQRTPLWANLKKIEEIYANCPKGYHVDHVFPLKGKLVSGLHVETNLQYLPARENLAKRNIYHV